MRHRHEVADSGFTVGPIAAELLREYTVNEVFTADGIGHTE